MPLGTTRSLTIRQTFLRLLAVILIPALLIQGIVYCLWYRTRLSSEVVANLEQARSLSVIVGNFVRDIRLQEQSIGAAILGLKAIAREQIEPLLKAHAEQCDTISTLHLVNLQGEVAASSRPDGVGVDLRDRSYFQAILSGKRDWTVSDVLRTRPTGEPAFVIACGIKDTDRLWGVLVAVIDLHRTSPLLHISRPDKGVLALYDSAGVQSMREPDVPVTFESLVGIDGLLAEALRGRESMGEARIDASGTRHIAARVPIPDLGWVAGASRPLVTALSPVNRAMILSCALTVLATLLSGLIALRLGRRVVNEVQTLRDYSAAAGRGESRGPIDGLTILELQKLGGEYAATIDKLSRAEEATRRQAEELARSNSDLEQFAYVASHDLQEPLRAVSGYLQLLERRYRNKLDADADEFIRFAVDGATRMRQLINDLLSYSRVRSRRSPSEWLDANEVLEGTLKNLEAMIAESAAVVTHDHLPTVYADRQQLGQVLQNLVANAIKFRGAASPRIHVSAQRGKDEWEFKVQDNGIGIAPEFHERVFDVFQRLHGRDEYDGTGIGLSICKRIVERHGGRIWVRSALGQGAVFHFTIPGVQQ